MFLQYVMSVPPPYFVFIEVPISQSIPFLQPCASRLGFDVEAVGILEPCVLCRSERLHRVEDGQLSSCEPLGLAGSLSYGSDVLFESAQFTR